MEKRLKIGINGFGRIGRALFRILYQSTNYQVVHINDLYASDNKQVQYLIKYDSIYGRFANDIKIENSNIFVHNSILDCYDEITLSFFKSTLEVEWQKRGVDVVIEATGDSDSISASCTLVSNGVSYVLVTSHCNYAAEIFVPGVSNSDIFPRIGNVISTATCDLVASGPIIHSLLSLGEIESLNVVSIHPYLNYQPLLDEPLSKQSGSVNQSNYGLGRAALFSVIPKGTSLEAALISLFPSIKNKTRIHSYRVPTAIVCYGDMTVRLNKKVAYDEVLNALKCKYPVIGVSTDQLVSIDHLTTNHAAVVDLRWLKIRGDEVSIVYAYDNEWGYANYVVEVLNLILKQIN